MLEIGDIKLFYFIVNIFTKNSIWQIICYGITKLLFYNEILIGLEVNFIISHSEKVYQVDATTSDDTS